VGRRKAAQENRTNGGRSAHHGHADHHDPPMAATTGCGVHHGLAVVVSAPVGPASLLRYILVFHLRPQFLPWIISIGSFWASL